MFRLVCPPPPVLRGCAPPNRKQKHFVFFEILGPVPPRLTGIHTQNAVNEHRDVVHLPQNSAADRQALGADPREHRNPCAVTRV